MFDASLCLTVARFHQRVDVQFVRVVFFQLDVDAVLRNIFFSAFHGFAGAVAKHFQPFFGTANESTQRHGNRQPDHACARYAYAHRVFQNVRAQPQLYPFGHHTQQLRGFGNAQRHSHRFGASDGGHHFLTN